MATDLLMVKVVIDNKEVSHRSRGQRPQYNQRQFQNYQFQRGTFNRTTHNTTTATNPTFREVKQITTEVEAVAGVLSNSEDAVMVRPIIRVITALTNISIIHMINRENSTAHPVTNAAVSIIPLSTATKENMTKIILWKR